MRGVRGNTPGVFETYTHFRVRDLVRSEPRLEYIDLRVSRIYKELGSDSIRNNIKSIKDSTGKEWYEVLEESTNIVQTLDTTGLIDTE